MLKLLSLFCVLLSGFQAFATDHNEPDLLNSFYRDRDGSGADIYHVFAYPSRNGENLNLVLTLAPVPDTGRFEPSSVQRIFLRPSVPTDVRSAVDDYFREDRVAQNNDPGTIARKWQGTWLGPIVQTSKDLMLADANNLPFNQSRYPELLITFNNNGMKAKIFFKNFNFSSPSAVESVIVESSGKELDPKKLKFAEYKGVKLFAGGRDDAFFNDIGGFFRSINWASALDGNREFQWEGGVSYLEDAETKETHRRVKGLIEKNVAGETAYGGDVVFSAKDIREGNNVNTLSFVIPVHLISKNVAKERIIRVWAESFLTEEAFNKINKR